MQVNKSAIKRHKQSEVRRLHNRMIKSKIKTWARKIREAAANDQKEDALKIYKEYSSLVDRAVSKGIYHVNNAARKKSRLFRIVMTNRKS
ncbi:MAG: 30S ribosomal protein S20 [Spirochaetales bacterium]|nr:30S ribosomal protein S20 [Spirochaetales bacterium]